VTRVIAGAARGRRLQVPPGDGTRPTSDRAREALFGTLESLLGAWAGRRVLDLYAGSGAVGLEALSRGAAHALLVEADARAARTLAANVATLGLAGAEVRRGRVERVAAHGLPGPTYDVVFADPPYDLTDDELRTVLADLRPAVADAAVVVVERATRGGAWTWPVGYEEVRSRRYGEATLWYGRATQPARRPASAPAVEEGTA
jgi:16S rRNA (guanine966-N2)-methyltransferase